MNETDIIHLIRSKNADSIFLIFINGRFLEKYSDLQFLSNELTIEKSTQNGLTIRLCKNTELKKPLHILFLQTQSESVKMHLQHHILLEENSELTLVEEYISLNAENYSNQIELEIIMQKNARIHYHKIQNEDKSATHLANVQIKQSSGSEVNHFSLTLGGRQARDDLSVEQNESASTCQLYGLYQLTENHQQIEHHLYVDHMAELGQSKMLYKGIVDKKSKATFKGKVHVHKLAQKINAQQANHNLLLSNDSQVDSKPELEIYADEVKCTHGATIGQLDQEALFYLRSRGVDQDSAKRLLLDAFADEVIRAIKNPTIQQYIRGLI